MTHIVAHFVFMQTSTVWGWLNTSRNM